MRRPTTLSLVRLFRRLDGGHFLASEFMVSGVSKASCHQGAETPAFRPERKRPARNERGKYEAKKCPLSTSPML